MRFRKVYIEITNACNLSCSFCIKNFRKINYMTIDNYKKIIDKIKKYTKEIYFHILGEPLLHPNLLEFIKYANDNNILVNITTNGYLINKIASCSGIHRINISLHSFDDKYKIDLKTYLDNVFNIIDNFRNKTFVSLRLWVGNKYANDMLKYINNRYNSNIDKLDNNIKTKITSNLIIDSFHEFIWPDLNNDYYNDKGRCLGLIDHIGILSDGTIIPCCLDSKGIIKLGNIYEDSIDDILNQDVVVQMIDGFKKGYKCQELCKHCSFLETSKK